MRQWCAMREEAGKTAPHHPGHLVLDRVSVMLGETLVLDRVSLTVSQREFVCVIGTSGGGKTTLLRTIAGVLPPIAGSVTLGGTPVRAPSPRTAMVFQHFGLFPWKTVRANVAYGLEVQGRREALDRVQRLLEALHLGDAAEHYPAQLSGGMKQRVGIARALAVEPELLLLDEPFSSVDALTRERLQNEVLRLWDRSRGMSAVMVTHDIDEAILMADRILVIAGPPGHVRVELPIDLPRPRNAQDVHSHPGYPALRKRLWDALERDDVRRPEVA